MPRIRPLLLVACALAAAPLSAQTRADGGTVDARMRAFVQVARGDDPRDALAGFLPRNGPVTWVPTIQGGGERRVGRWVLSSAELLSASDQKGWRCGGLSSGMEAFLLGTLMPRIPEDGRPWRRVSGTRFVPPGMDARSPAFVEWRREDGRWVISALGDGREHVPRVLGGQWPNRVVRDAVPAPPLALPLAGHEPLAPGARWYEENEPIAVDGCPLVKFGHPRPLHAGEVRRIGAVHGVGVYVEAADRGRPEVVYVPISADGRFQPYQNSL